MKADLRQAMRKQANPSVTPNPTESTQAGTARRRNSPRSRAGKRQVAAYFPPAVQKQLKLLTVEKDTTVQGLLAEALNDLFAKYGKPEIAPN